MSGRYIWKKGLKQSVHLTALLLVTGLTLSACQSNKDSLKQSDPMSTGSTSAPSLEQTAILGKRWEKDPNNIALGLSYADGLNQIGQDDQELQVLATLADSAPKNNNVQLIYGKKLLSTGKYEEAITILQKVTEGDPSNWQAWSAYGLALDQYGQHEKAREQYKKALSIQPNQLTVVNNLGMSYALEGNLKEAEATLRSAMTLPQAKSQPRIRQNLALVVGLQGRFEESRKIASEDLPPEDVDANLAYLQKMLSQPNNWQQLAAPKK